MLVLTGRENIDVTDADVVVGWMLEADADCCWSTGDREWERKLMWGDQKWDIDSTSLKSD
jgi:hypothetical protein